MKHIQVAIDGPGGAGKSTISKAIAKELEILYVDTGAMYRAIGYYMAENGIDPDNETDVTNALPSVDVTLKYIDGVQNVFLNGENLGDKIRTQLMSSYASKVSRIGSVREFLKETQRRLARENSVIMDGRDIGTVILPNADVKIFLTASDEVRARRRYNELLEKGQNADYETVLSEMRERDANDSNRAIAPLAAADDAVLFDNSTLTFEESVSGIISVIKEKCSL